MVPWGYVLACKAPCVNSSTSGTFILCVFFCRSFDFQEKHFIVLKPSLGEHLEGL
jgi:hypothetical protein